MTTNASFEEQNLQNLLEKVARDENFEKPEFEVSYGSKPGDNFVGRIYRAVITESNSGRKLSLIFKASPISKHRKDMLSTDDMFLLESEVYQVVLPTFNALLKKQGVADSVVFPGTARCYRADIKGRDSEQSHVLVLEDKVAEGYQMFSGKDKVLDAQHCRVVLKKLALWHATSMALNHHDPETFQKLKKLLKKDKLFLFDKDHPMWVELMGGAKDTINKIKDKLHDGTLVKLEHLMQIYQNEFLRLNNPSPNLPCIIQGDCWTNNILFKYKQDGTLEDICLVDLQIGRVASPVTDVVYFLHIVTTKEVRDEHYDSLIRYYHDQLSSNLRKLGCDPDKIIPWELLQDELRSYGRIGAYVSLTALPMMVADTSDINVDLHAAHHEGNIFVGRANATSQEKQDKLFQRIVDIIEDSRRLGYI